MTNEILKKQDELKQKIYHQIKDIVISKSNNIKIVSYQTDIINMRLNVHEIFVDLDDDKELTVYVKYNMVGDDEEFVDELYCFNIDEMFNILKNINNYEME